MIQNILRNLGGVENYGTLSLCLFSLIFLCVLVWTCLQRKAHLDRMSRIPLESEESNHGEKSHE